MKVEVAKVSGVSEKKKIKKGSVIALSVLALFLTAIIIFFIFGDGIIALVRISSVKRTVEASSITVVRDPLVSEGINYTATEKVLYGEDAKEIRLLLLSASKGCKFKENKAALTGDWDLHIEFICDDNKSCTIYLLEDSFYISKNGTRTLFEIKDSALEEYKALYDKTYSLTRLPEAD